MMDQQVGVITALPVQPGCASTTVMQIDPISPANSQSTTNTRRRNRSWSSSLFGTGLMLLFMFLSITATEGFKDVSEIIPQRYTPYCNLHPQMPIYMMSGKELFPSCEMECNINRNQGVCNIMERYVHKARETNLPGVCLQGKWAILEDLHQQPNVRGLRARCAHQDQHRVINYNVAHRPFDITNVVVLDPGLSWSICSSTSTSVSTSTTSPTSTSTSTSTQMPIMSEYSRHRPPRDL